MKKISFILLTIMMLFIVGCNSVSINEKVRIIGIIDACKNNPQYMNVYLQQKVQNKQITEIVAFTIQESLKNGKK